MHSAKILKKTFEPSNTNFYRIIQTFELKIGMYYSKQEMAALIKPFKFILIGMFSHVSLNLFTMLLKPASLGLICAYNIGISNFKHIIIKLFNEEDHTWI